jgi:hypothetical protein
MSCKPPILCNDESRLVALKPFAAPHNGIQAVEIVHKDPPDPLVQRLLAVYFYGSIPAGLDNTHLDRLSLTGGVRISGNSIRFQDATVAAGYLQLTVDRAGDFSDYILTIDHPDLDPLYSCRRFNFKVECPNPFDCQRPGRPPPPLPPDPLIDYQSKDYQSFRRALLDFLPTRVPGFTESSEADLAITLAELFAYAGDQLSYLQDSVSNEAYLQTVRQRVSAKRHARLMDYRMHDGLAARAVLQFQVNPSANILQGLGVTTQDTIPGRRIYFETDEAAQCFREHNEITPYTWLDTICCLPVGSTSTDLTGGLPNLAAGQMLLFEEVLAEVLGPDGNPVVDSNGAPVLVQDAADPKRRQIVRLTNVKIIQDPAVQPGPQSVTRVTWAAVDALIFDFCLQSDATGHPATVARGNLVRASHGQSVINERVDPSDPTLSQGPLTWLDPPQNGPLTFLYPPDAPDPKSGVSTVRLTIDGNPWTERESLLDSTEDSPDFVVDTDNDGRGILRFGDGQLGKAVPNNALILASYRIGNGAAGNVGAEALTKLAVPLAGVDTVRNPLPAVGGIDPEPIVDVQRDATQEFSAVQYRAVTAADYAKAAAGVTGIYAAAAIFRWTGSWLTVFVAVDPVGREDLPDTTRQAVVARLDSYRQAGYDLEVQPPLYVPLRIELEVCVLSDHFQADVEEAVLDVLSSGIRLDGSSGFFHPNQFTFWQNLYLSRLYAAVQGVEGVRAVHAKIFKRLNQPDYGELATGILKVGLFEIVRLDNDPSLPDNGILTLDMEGGK